MHRALVPKTESQKHDGSSSGEGEVSVSPTTPGGIGMRISISGQTPRTPPRLMFPGPGLLP